MDLPTQLIAPIASLWVIHSAIFTSAAFVNGMRETVISGRYGRDEISVKHRKQIRTDWMLSMAATVLVCFIFAGIVAAVSRTVLQTPMNWVGGALALYSLACGIGFIICAWGDSKLMKEAIDCADGSPLPAGSGAPASIAR